MYQGFSGVLFIGRKITVTLYLVYENENSCHKKKGNVSTTKQCPGLNQTTKKQHCTVSTKSNRWGLDLCSVFSDTPKVTLPHPTTAWMQSHSKSMQNCTSLRSDKPKQKKKRILNGTFDTGKYSTPPYRLPGYQIWWFGYTRA